MTQRNVLLVLCLLFSWSDAVALRNRIANHPTTWVHDEKTGRDPFYWRNMNENDYEAFKRENCTALANHSWQ